MRSRLRAALWWGASGLGLALGLYLALWPGRLARAFIAPSPTVTIRTVSDDVEKTTTWLLGAPPVPIDVNGDRLPDVDVGVELTRAEFLPAHPLAPTLTVARNALSLNDPVGVGKRASPPLVVEIFVSTFDPETQETDTLSFGYDTKPGGSIPVSFTASLLGNIQFDTADPEQLAANVVNPLRAEVRTPGYNGPLRLFSNIDAQALLTLLGNVSLGYDPLPERVAVKLTSTGEGMQIHYEQSSMIPEVDLDARAHLEREAGITDVATLVQRLPAVIDVELKNTAAGGSFTYDAAAPTNKPDISARFRSVPAQGDPMSVVAQVSGLPSKLAASWPVEGGTAKKVSFDAPDPVGSVGFEVRNFLDDTDAPDLPPPLRLPPRDHVQFVSRGLGDNALWAARGHISLIRAVSFEQGPNLQKVIHARLGDGAHPLGAGIDVQTADGRLLVESTVTNLPADLTVTFRPQDDAQPEVLPLLFSYAASAETDVVSHIEIANSLGIGCRERGSTCLDATVRHVPENLQATFSSRPDVGGRLRVSAVPRPGGAQPDIVADLVMHPADTTKDPIDVHARVQRFPRTLVSTYHLTNKQPDLVDLHACEWDGTACTDGAPPGIGQVNFRMRNFLDGSFGTDELTPTNYVSAVSRKKPDRFEVSGQTTDIRHIAYRKVGQVGGVHVEMGKGEPFRVHADIDTPDESPPQQQIADSVIGALPNVFNICFRSPLDSAVAPVTDATGITSECQTNQAFGGTVQSTPFTVIYDATGASTPTPVVEARAKVLFGGTDPAGAGERQSPQETITIGTRIDRLPTKIRADYQPAKDLGQDVPGRPLKVSYEANSVIDHVTLDLADRIGTSQCEDPRPGKESLCAHVDIRKLPTLLRGTITNTPSDSAPSTTFLFEAGTPAQADAMRIGCTGLTADCAGFDPGLHLVKVKNPPFACLPPNCSATRPQVINASVEGLPPFITGAMDQAKKKDPETGVEAPAPSLVKLDLQACSGFVQGVCQRDDFRAVRFSLEDFLVPDPIGADTVPATLPSPPFAAGTPLGGEFFHFVKRGEDFRISGALRGFQGATYAGPGDTTAVQVNTTNVARNLETIFDLQEASGSNIRVAGTIQNLPKEIQFCFRSPRTVAFGPNPLQAGRFCDASNASPDNAPPAPTKDQSDTRIRLFGDPSVAGKPNALVDFALAGPGTNTRGTVTAVGLPSVMQATFSQDNVGFNKPDLPGFPLPANNTIESVRFDIRKDFPPDGSLPTDPPFDSVRHFPSDGDHSLDDPAAVPISNAYPSPYVSLVKNVARLRAKGIVNGIQEAFMFADPCFYPEGGAPDPVPLCKRLRAKIGVGVPGSQILAFYLNLLDGEDRTFLTADVGPLPKLIDARIDTEASFEPKGNTRKEKAELKTDRPPIIVLRTCEEPDCASVPAGSPAIRGVFETGKVEALKRLSSVGFEDRLFQPGGPPANPDLDAGASVDAYSLPVTDRFYDANDAAAAQDLKDVARNTPPGPGDPNATAFRIVTMENGASAVRGRLKIPFPGTLDVGAPIMLSEDTAANDPYNGKKISDIAMSYRALGFGATPQPIDFGRAVVVVQDLQPGAFHGGETVIIASNLPGVGKLRMVNHKEKFLGQSLLDVRGEFSSDLKRLELRSWAARDETGELKRVTARGGIPVPNLRVNVHNIPGGPEGWRARMYVQETEDIEDRANKDPCADAIVAVIFNFIPCVGSQYADFGLDFKPALANGAASPPARLIDAVVSSTSGQHAKISGFATPNGGAPADFTARAALRIDPLNINISIGVPGLAGAVFSLFSQLDVNFYSIGQNMFDLAFGPPAHVKLIRNDPPGADGDHAVQGIGPGLYLRPVWDVDWLFGFGNVWWFVFFGIGPPILPPPPTTLPMSGLDCGFGTLAGSFFTEFEYLGSAIFGSGSNGYTLTGGDYEQNIVLNAITPAGVPIGDIAGGLITRGLAALINTIFCAISADDLPAGVPDDPLKQFIDPGGAPPPTVPPAAPPPPPPPHVTVSPGVRLLCGNHDYASLSVPAGATIKVSNQALLDASGNPINAPSESVAACLPKDRGSLRITSKKIAGDPASGRVVVAAGGKIDANGSMVGEPPVTLKFTDDPATPVPPDQTGTPVPFLPPVGTPNQSSTPPVCGGGAGHGGGGGASACRPSPNNVGGTAYGNALVDPATDPGTGEQMEVMYPGSKGADAGDPDILFGFKPSGGAGGGMISIEAHTVELAGALTAQGSPGQSGSALAATCLAGSSAGGGSGGGVYVAATRLTTVAGVSVSARGGGGGFGKAGGGGGGGGRVKVLGVIQAGPIIPFDVAGGAAPGPVCDGLAPQPGGGGTVLAPPNFQAGGAMSDATGAPGSRLPNGRTTRWTSSNAVTVTSSSAATAGGPWPLHQVILCFVKEPAARSDSTKRLPEELPMKVPEPFSGQPLGWYLHDLNCRFSDVHSLFNGIETGTTFGLGAPGEGYYGFFTVAARRVSLGPGDLPSTPCFSPFTSFFPPFNFVDPDCQFEAVPKAPDFVLAVDRTKPAITKVEHFPSPSAPGQRFVPPDQTAQYTNAGALDLRPEWTDGFNSTNISDQKTNATTLSECFSNDGGVTKTCWGLDDPVQPIEKAHRDFPQSIDWRLAAGEGLKNVTLTVTDLAGNTSSAFTKSMTVDTSAPDVTVTGNPPSPPADGNGWYRTPPAATLALAGPDTGVGIDVPTTGGSGVFYVFDDPKGSRQAYTVPVTMPEGDHTIFGVAVDRLGNVSASPSSFHSRLDVRKPLSAVTVAPGRPDGDNGWYLERPFVGVRGVDNVGGSGVGKIRFRTGPSLAQLGPEQDYSGFFQVGEGTTVVCAKAIDKAQNVGAQSCSPLMKVDSTKPVSPLSAPAPGGEHNWHLVTPGASVSTIEVGSGLGPAPLTDLDLPEAGLWVSVDRLPFFRAGTSFATTVPEGRHDLRWFAEDAAGNRELIQRRGFDVDTSDPLSSLSSFPPAPNSAGWFRSDLLAALAATDGEDNSGPHTASWGVDGAAVNAYARPFAVGEGSHAANFFSRDVAGRAEQPQSAPLRVDVRAPSADPLAVPGPLPVLSTLGAPAPLGFTLADDQSKAVRAVVRIFDLGGKLVRDIDAGVVPTGAAAVSWDGEDDAGDRAVGGIYYFRVLTVDEAGNVGMSGESREFLLV